MDRTRASRRSRRREPRAWKVCGFPKPLSTRVAVAELSDGHELSYVEPASLDSQSRCPAIRRARKAWARFIREFLDEFYAISDPEAKLRAIADEPPLLDDEPPQTPIWRRSPNIFFDEPYRSARLDAARRSLSETSLFPGKARLVEGALHQGKSDGVSAAHDFRRRGAAIAAESAASSQRIMLLNKADILKGSSFSARRRETLILPLILQSMAALRCSRVRYAHATRDVDAVIRAITLRPQGVREIAAEYDWPENWFNDAVKGFTSASEQLRLMQDFQGFPRGGLRVHVPTPEYLLAMKCMAMRIDDPDADHDVADIKNLAGLLQIETPEAFFDIIARILSSR